jgi:hypothetical protein
MSLQLAAQHLASKGRDGDTELVHMTKGEIKGLQGLALAHGGSLSINPNTGLVEANFLKRILPMVAGAALSPFITPMGAAALVGGFETARTGDIGKGLMAGLGAYGGAGLTQGLSTAGAQTGAAGTTTAGVQATPIATEATQNMGANAIKEAYGAQTLATPISTPPINMGAEALKAGVPAPVTMGNVSSGFGQLGSEAGRSAIYNALPKYTLPAAGVSLVNAATPEPEVPGMPGEEDYGPYKLKRLSANFQGSTPVQPNPYYRPRGLGYAAGGDVMMAAGGSYEDEPMSDDIGMAAGGIAHYSNQGRVRDLPESVGVPRTGIFRDTDSDTARKDALEAAMIRNRKLAKASNIKLAPMPKTSVKGLGDVEEMAGGGSLGGYSDGGRMLKGPGDGMSDSIPATIGRKQPARLADGEFVVPADVVSHLGNGSTDAGAKKLYTMMDKIRKARTGKKKQAPAVRADKYLPA